MDFNYYGLNDIPHYHFLEEKKYPVYICRIIYFLAGHASSTPNLALSGQVSPDLPSCSGTARWSCWSEELWLCGWHPGCGGHTHSLAGQTEAGADSWPSGWWASPLRLGWESPQSAPAGDSPEGKKVWDEEHRSVARKPNKKIINKKKKNQSWVLFSEDRRKMWRTLSAV